MATIDHHGSDYHTAHAPDKRAGFVGLIAGVVLLLVVMYSIVLWTNARFASHHAGTTTATEAPAAKH